MVVQLGWNTISGLKSLKILEMFLSLISTS